MVRVLICYVLFSFLFLVLSLLLSFLLEVLGKSCSVVWNVGKADK